MNFEYFIARKLFFGKKNQNVISPIINIALTSIVLGLIVMIVSVAVVTGFQNQIREKVIGFGAHIQISSFDANNSFENKPIDFDSSFVNQLLTLKGIKHVQRTATKAGILKTENEIQGVVLKGISKDYDWSFLKKRIISGSPFIISDTGKTNEILISKIIANKLNLATGQEIWMYFIQEPPRYRKFIIAGIFETGIEDLDKTFVIGDIRHVQKLNNWTENQIGGYELYIHDFKNLDNLEKLVYENISYDLNVASIKKQYPQIFDWLDLLDMNVIIILTLMVVVAIINMITMLLIIIIDRTNMIGIFKALGASNWSIRKIFLFNATYMIIKGMLIGNFIGIGLCLIQRYFSIIKLDLTAYYLSEVPINIDIFYIFLLNVGTLVVCFLSLIVPSIIVTKISPVKAIRFS